MKLMEVQPIQIALEAGQILRFGSGYLCRLEQDAAQGDTVLSVSFPELQRDTFYRYEDVGFTGWLQSDALNTVAGAIALTMLQETIDNGGTIEIPSLGIVIEPDLECR